MKKRGIRQIVISIFMAIVFSYTVQAALPDVLAKFGKLVFHDIPAMGDYGFKFIIWIILFTLFHLGLSQIGAFQGRYAGILSFFLSLGTVLMIPNDVVVGIFGTFAPMIVLIIGLAIPIGALYIANDKFGGTTPYDNVMRGIIYLIMSYGLYLFIERAGLFLFQSAFP